MSKNIRVVCRLRPVNKKEESMGGEICVKYTEKNIKVHVNLFSKNISFYNFI